MLLQERLEVPLGDARQRDIGVGLDGRAPTLVVQEGHLAERVAGAKLPGLALHGADRDGALRDDHEADALAATDDDLVAGWVLDGLQLALDRLELPFG